MIDQDTARLLISEALKDRLSITDNDSVETRIGQNNFLNLDLVLQTEDNKFSFGGPITDIEISSKRAHNFQFKSSVQDAHELLNLINGRNCICLEYNIEHLCKSISFAGPFKTSIRKIINFNYEKNQCTVGIELIETKQ